MKEFQNIITKIKKTTDSVGKKKIILLAVASIFLLASSYFDSGNDKSKDINEKQVADNEVDYKEKIESQLETLIAQIEGINKVHVLISLESTGEKILQTDSENSEDNEKNENTDKSSSSKKKNTVIVQNEQGENPYIIQENYPKINGVAIVANGITSDRKEEIIQMVISLYNVEAHKVSVICSD